MRVLLISEFYPPKISGIAQHVRRLALNLAKRGHEIQVLVSDPSHKAVENEENVEVVRTKHILSSFKWIFTDKEMCYVPPLPDFVLKKGIMKVIAAFGPDIVHVHGWPMYTVAALKKRFPRLPIISTFHDYGFFCPKQTSYNENERSICYQREPLVFRCVSCARNSHGLMKSFAIMSSMLAFRKLLGNLDQIVAVSDYLRNVTIEAGFNNVRVIPNFIDLNEMKKIEKTCFGNEGSFLTDILYVGALVPYKGVHVLLKAYKTLKNNLNFLPQLTLVGRSHLKWSFNISDSKVKMISNMPSDIVFSYMQHAKIVVVPSVWPEASSLVTLEAMTFKKPVIASAIGSLREFVQDRETGLLVPPNDHLELASAIKYLLEKPQRMKHMGIEGYNRVVKLFSAEKVVPQIEDLYKEVGE